jgi:signal transduction histidine kinase
VTKIVSDLQDYARALKPENIDVNLQDLIVKVFERTRLPDNIKLAVNVKGVLCLKTDPTFVQRALTNLVNNALQAMPDGGELGLAAYRTEKSVVITVRDSGEGIPEGMKNHMFKPLITTKAKGQGLGLAVVKKLVEGLNGKVSFESVKGKGYKVRH